MKNIKSIPILFLTARDMEIDEVRGFASGADDYIKKPFSVSCAPMSYCGGVATLWKIQQKGHLDGWAYYH